MDAGNHQPSPRGKVKGYPVAVFTVGGFARLAGVSAKVLRAWDAAGLFVPAWVDPSSGYRYYSPAQLPELRRILALRDVGLPLAEIGGLVRGGSDLRAALERRRAELESERREVDRRLAALDIRVAPGADATAEPDVVVRHIAAEPVATFDVGLAERRDVGQAFYELESHVRDLGLRAHRPPGALPAERTIFVPLRRPIAPTDRIGVRRLPACRAATLLHRGDYDTLGTARAALEQWAAAARLDVTGPLRILYLQFGAEPELRVPRGWVVPEAAQFVTEVQLPVA
jgi:DNA-binding transcriptional MerR regulator